MKRENPLLTSAVVLLHAVPLMASTPPETTVTATQIAPVQANSTQAVLPNPPKARAVARAPGQTVTGPAGLTP